jgi:hypothetical protein
MRIKLRKFHIAVLGSVLGFSFLFLHPKSLFSSERMQIDRKYTASNYPYKPETKKGEMGAAGYFYGEAGVNNFRAGATGGFNLAPCHRLKISGEYLTQDLRYSFPEHHKHKWVSQYALGVEYEWLFKESSIRTLHFGTAYEHAFNRSFSMHQQGVSNPVKQRIAGSDGVLSFAGTTFSLWRCASLFVDVNFDFVKFHEHFHHHSVDKGWGTSLLFVQQLPKDFSFDLGSAFRYPFNDYSAALRWSHLFKSCGLNIGVFSHFTDGKHGVRHILTGGLQLGLSFGGTRTMCCRTNDEMRSCEAKQFCSLANWVMTPAVNVPIVLTKADSQVVAVAQKPCCTIQSKPMPTIDNGPSFTLDASPYFSSSCPITYSLTYTGNPQPPGTTITIDPNTGIITGGPAIDGTGQGIFITVTGTVNCAQTSQTFQFVN